MMIKLAKLPRGVNCINIGRRRILFAAGSLTSPCRTIPAPADTCDPEFRIALDVGHTLARPGATSAYGIPEFEYNRRLANAVDRRLQDRGVSTVLIGQHGLPIGLTERTAIAAKACASAFLSIHHDSVQPHYLSTWSPAGSPRQYSDAFSGYSLFISTQTTTTSESRRLAEILGDALLASGQTPSLHHAEAITGENHLLLDPHRGIYRFDELAVLRTARMPAVLLEAAIIVNRREEDALRSSEGLERMVAAITQAILSYCHVHSRSVSTGSAEQAPRHPAGSVKRP